MFEALFKYPRALYERGELVFAPLQGALDAYLLAAVAAGLVVVSLMTARRLRSLGPARLAVLGMLQLGFVAGALVLLSRPAVEVATLAPGANTVAVLVDTSESMSFSAGESRGTRLAAAASLVDRTIVPELSRFSDVATFTFGESARRHELADLKVADGRTRLMDALENVLASFQGTPLAAVVVITDGADNGSRSLDPARLSVAGVPVHTIGVGPAVLTGEVEIAEVAVPPDAPPESRVVAEVVLEHSAAGPAAVKVFDGARLVAVRNIELDPGYTTQRVSVAFDSGPGGIRQLAFEVEPPDGDGLTGNNRLERLLTVSERERRVLYLEGEPRWEYKFIRRALAGDQVAKLTSWLRTTGNKTYRQHVSDADELAGGFPASRAELFGFDVVVLGSLAATDFTDEQHQWLEAFVADRGGSLLALAGREALADGGWDVTPLAGALPVRLARGSEAGYRPLEGQVRATRLGLRSSIVQLSGGEGADPWASLPPLGDYQRMGAVKPAAAVLLEMVAGGKSRPLLVTQPYGLGTAAVLATASTWRWRMRTPSDDLRHTLFWRQLLRQLGESARQPREARFAVDNGEIAVKVMERDATFTPVRRPSAAVNITGPGVQREPLALTSGEAPGVLQGRYRPTEPGVYRVDVNLGDERRTTRFVRVGEQRPEHFDAAQNVPLLERIAKATGGRYWRPEEAGGIAEALTFASAGVKRTERYPLWDMPAAFLLLILIKGSEWLLRRRWGRI